MKEKKKKNKRTLFKILPCKISIQPKKKTF